MKAFDKFLILASAFVPAFLIAPGKPTTEQRELFGGRNYAHRGLHTKDKSIPENSLRAFDNAAQKGYGIELDVQLSRDGKLVVFHDDYLERMCGIDGRVCDYSYLELSQMKLCNSEIDTIPLLSEVLKVVNGRVPIIVELKDGKRNFDLCKKTRDLLREYEGDTCIESFNPLIVRWFKENAPEILRGQLAADEEGYENFYPFGAYVLSHCLLNFLARPQFIAYKITKKPLSIKLCEALGAMKVCWTSRDTTNEKNNDMVIFEFYEPSVKYK